MNINKASINLIIKEYEQLVRDCKHPKIKINFESQLQSYQAVKDLLDKVDN